MSKSWLSSVGCRKDRSKKELRNVVIQGKNTEEGMTASVRDILDKMESNGYKLLHIER